MFGKPFLVVFAISFIFSIAGILLHYEAMRSLSFLLPRIRLQPRQKMIVVVGGMLLAHLVEIMLFAAAFWLFWELDAPTNLGGMTRVQALYLSIESYTSLGTSSGFPIGQLRVLAGMEALLGLILIAWSASYTFLAMSKFWEEH